jgi:hypothetical protein
VDGAFTTAFGAAKLVWLMSGHIRWIQRRCESANQ